MKDSDWVDRGIASLALGGGDVFVMSFSNSGKGRSSLRRLPGQFFTLRNRPRES